jgi:hypothetical protein
MTLFSDGIVITAIARMHYDGVVETAAKGPGGDQACAVTRETGDTVDLRGLNGLGAGHGRQDGGQPARQPRRARPWMAEQEEVMVKAPASPAVSRGILQRCAARTPELAVLVSTTPVTAYGASLMYSRCV